MTKTISVKKQNKSLIGIGVEQDADEVLEDIKVDEKKLEVEIHKEKLFSMVNIFRNSIKSFSFLAHAYSSTSIEPPPDAKLEAILKSSSFFY